MTVAELIEKLREMPPDAEVKMDCDDGADGTIRGVRRVGTICEISDLEWS